MSEPEPPRRPSRRKRRQSAAPPQVAAASQAAASQAAATPQAPRRPAPPPAQPLAKVLAIGRYERADFERVEGMLGNFANRRLGAVIEQVARGFFAAASPQERQLPELRTAFYSFFLYGWRDGQGTRVIDLFRRHAPPLQGRPLAALEALCDARLGLVTIGDINVKKQRIRGRDPLRDEAVTLRDKNAAASLRPGDHLLCWQIPWGTSWQPIGVATRIEKAKSEPLQRALESMANNLRAVRRELPVHHAANLFWVAYRVAGMRI